MGIGLLPGIAAIWKVAIATTPSAITLLLNPIIRQLFPEQERVLPAFVVDAPGTNVIPVMAGETPKDHWKPLVCAPPADVRLIGTATVLPGVADPDPIDKVTVCPKAIACKPTRAKILETLGSTCVYRLGLAGFYTYPWKRKSR